MGHEQKYWFPSVPGWGLPTTWQGWLVFLMYVGGTILLSLRISGSIDLFWFVPLHLVLTGVFLWIVWRKGEPTSWRWGDNNTTTRNQP